MEFLPFHRYNKLVRRGMVKPLTCTCNNEFTVTLGPNDEPVLRCYYCGSTVTPGQAMYDRIRAVVSEHFVE